LVIFSAGRVAQTYLSATDRLRQVTVASAAGVIAGVAALAVLAPRFGADGAGAADSVGYLGYTAFMLWGLRAPRGDSRFSLGLRGPRSLRSGRRRITSAATPTAPPREAAGAPTAVKSGAAALARASRAALARVAGVTTAVTTAVAVGVISTEGTKLMVLAAGLIVAAVVVLIPEAGLYVLAVLIPVSQTSGGASLITVKDLLVLIVACLAGQVIAGRMVRPRAGAVALGLALVGYFMLSAALSGGPDGNGVHNLIDALTLGLTLLCLPLIISDNAASRRALMVFAFTAAATSIAEIPVAQASLVQSGGNTAIAAGQTGALNHNAEGALFVLALGVLLARLPQTQGKVARLAVGAGTALITAGIAFSFSRSSYFGAIAVIVLFALRRSIRGLIGLAAVALCIIPLVPASVLARINTVWSSNGLDPSSASRLDLWTSAIRMFTVHPVFGVGYLNFSASLPSYFVDTGNYPISDILFYQLDFAHNTYLSVLAETGIIGALLVGALIVTGWHRAWLASRAGDWAGESALLGLVGVGVCSIFGEPLFVPAVFAGLLFVVLVTQKTGKVSRDGILHHLAISRPRPPAAHYASRGHAHRRRLVL